MKNILDYFKKKDNDQSMQRRTAQRHSFDSVGFYKVLDRNKFFARRYEGEKENMRFLDISSTGCAFRTKELIPDGAYVEIEFDRFSDDFILDKPVTISCESVYCHPLNNSINRIGAKFLEIEHKHLEKIQRFSEGRVRA